MNPRMDLCDAIEKVGLTKPDICVLEDMIRENEQPRGEHARLLRDRLIRQDVLKKLHKLLT